MPDGQRYEEVGVRIARPEDVELPPGYSIEPVVVNLNYPTSIAWDADGAMLIAESTLPFGEVARTEIRIARRRPDGTLETVAGGFPRLINDIAVQRGQTYVSHLGRISVVEGGQVRDLIAGLPSRGLHQNNGIAFGPDGRLYFAQGTVSNVGVVDAYALDHLRRTGGLEDHDIPGATVILTGRNYETTDLVTTQETRTTGAFSSWGVATHKGQRIDGPAPGQAASGAIMSANPDGSGLRVYAWGFRNPFGLAFSPSGGLYTVNNGANRVPPRRVSADPDTLWAVEEGVWYGWPDFFAAQPVTDPAFKPPDAGHHEFLIANHDELLKGRPRPPDPVVPLGLHVAPTKLDFCRRPQFGYEGQAFLAEFGSLLTPLEGLLPTFAEGHQVVRVDLERRTVHTFAANRSGRVAQGPRGGLERPIDARFGPDGHLYIVDFGIVDWHEGNWLAPPATGIIWRVRHQGR